MSLLSYNELVKLVDNGVINAATENINGSSIDITLDDVIMTEDYINLSPVDLAAKKSITMIEKHLNDSYVLAPNEFILASSKEVFNLPDNISAEYKLKSSMARNGLEHLNAGWCDAHWHGSKLTLEIKNMTQHHKLKLTSGMKIGQVVFFKHAPVPSENGYGERGNYNEQKKVQESKGIE